MPIYCFTNLKGETIERMHSIVNIPKRITQSGVWYERDIAAEHGQFRNTPGNWPKVTELDGVCSHQAKDLHDYLQKKGVPTEVRPDGSMVLRDREHRRRVNAARGLHDMDGGYSD